MSSRSCLLVLCKNPILGKVKTRLANSVGKKKALEVYRFLLKHTAKVAAGTPSNKWIFYSNKVLTNDAFQGANYHKTLQVKGDLGARMQAAFEAAFEAGYEQAIIIGSDCYELSSSIVETALTALNTHDVVLGPAKDGGYYLLGLRQMIPAVFENKPWSQAHLLHETLQELTHLKYSYQLLPQLSDIDYLEDLPLELRKKFDI